MEGDPGAKLQEALSSQQVIRSSPSSTTFPGMMPTAVGTAGFCEPPPPYYIQEGVQVQSHPPNAPPAEPQPWSYPAAPKAFNVSDTPTPMIGIQPPSITRTGMFNSTVQLANSTIYTHYPTRVRCPKCTAEVMTRVDHQTGILTHMIAGGACFIGLACLCCCLGLFPYCIDSCKDTVHYCPSCGQTVAFVKRM